MVAKTVKWTRKRYKKRHIICRWTRAWVREKEEEKATEKATETATGSEGREAYGKRHGLIILAIAGNHR